MVRVRSRARALDRQNASHEAFGRVTATSPTSPVHRQDVPTHRPSKASELYGSAGSCEDVKSAPRTDELLTAWDVRWRVTPCVCRTRTTQPRALARYCNVRWAVTVAGREAQVHLTYRQPLVTEAHTHTRLAWRTSEYVSTVSTRHDTATRLSFTVLGAQTAYCSAIATRVFTPTPVPRLGWSRYGAPGFQARPPRSMWTGLKVSGFFSSERRLTLLPPSH